MSHHPHHKKAKWGQNPLNRITMAEANCIASMFRLYDVDLKGRIRQDLGWKILKSLGFDPNKVPIPSEVTLTDLVLTVDNIVPDPDPPLVGALHTFNGLMAHRDEEGTGDMVLVPEDISTFMEKLGRPPASIGECTLLMNSMLEYDDCTEVPILKTEFFDKELTNYAKKTNALKDFR